MNKKTLIAALSFIGLVAVAVKITQAPEKGAVTGERPRPFPVIESTSLDVLEITKDGKKTVIEKVTAESVETYRVISPVEFPADQQAAKEAFAAVAEIDFANIVSNQQKPTKASNSRTRHCGSPPKTVMSCSLTFSWEKCQRQ